MENWRNEWRNVENKGGNARNETGMRVQWISVGMSKIWVEMWKMLRIRMAMQGIKGGNLSIAVEMTQNSNGNDKFKEWKGVKIIEN